MSGHFWPREVIFSTILDLVFLLKMTKMTVFGRFEAFLAVISQEDIGEICRPKYFWGVVQVI